MQTADDIVNDEPLDITLRLNRVDKPDDHDSIDCWVHFVDSKGQFVKCTVFRNSDFSNYDWESAEYYEFQQVVGDIFNETVGIKPSWKTEITSLDTVPAEFESSSGLIDDPSTAPSDDSTSETARLAIDIEVLTLVDEENLELEDPSHIELLCIGVGYQPSPGSPAEATVLFRKGATPQHEIELLEELCEWIETRPASTLLTFGGNSFDLDHLQDRARLAEQACEENRDIAARITTILEDLTSVDLKPTAKQAFGYDSSLESTCRQIEVPVVETHWDIYDLDLNPASWREDQWNVMSNPPDKPLDYPVVRGSDVPFFGKRYLELLDNGNGDTSEPRALKELLRVYTQSDIVPLFSIAENELFTSNNPL